MTFALYRYGTIIERHATRLACLEAAERRGLAEPNTAWRAFRGRPVELLDGCEIRDITGQVELEEVIAKAPPRRRA